MNWNAIGAVGQILGSLATFVTVGYLVVQVHDSEMETRRAIAQARQERNMQINLAMATDERLVAIHLKLDTGLTGDVSGFLFLKEAKERAGLTAEEAFTFYYAELARWNNNAQAIVYLDELLPADRAQLDSSLRITLSDPAFALWYRTAKPTLNPDAVRYVDNLLAQSGIDPLSAKSVNVAQPGSEGKGK